MKLMDLLALVMDNLGRRKARVALTAIGVVIGTAAVVVLVSLAIGLQRNANQQLGGIGELTQIRVMPNYGEGGMMVMGAGGGSGSGSSQVKLITDQSIKDIAAVPGVAAVIPRDNLQMGARLTYNRLETYAQIIGVGATDLQALDIKAESGDTKLEKGSIIVGKMAVQNFYDPKQRPGQAPPPQPDLQDANVKLVVSKPSQDGSTQIEKTVSLRVAGILAETRGEADYSIYLPIEEIVKLNEWSLGRRINRNRDGYSEVIVKVKDMKNVLQITDQIKALGYQAWTPQSFVQGINSFYIILQVIFGGVGAIALLVAAIGIANTMAMAILERTREIGLMKAVGATNRDVLSIFLGEAAGIGFIGGVGGILLGWAGGQVLNVLAMAYLASQASQNGGMPPSVAVYTPPWLPFSTLIFSTLIGLISGVYPALRAATLVPVTALKYE